MVKGLCKKQEEFFRAGQPREVSFRIDRLKKLKAAIKENTAEIIQAINSDLRRPEIEIQTSEIIPVLKEIDLFINKTKKWARPNKKKTPWILQPGHSKVYREPYGSVLIMAPWNYPFQLLVSPLAGAIAAGNCAVVKPSEISKNTSAVIAELIENNFDSSYIAVARGGPDKAQQLLEEDFDLIFFTGSEKIGRIVMKKAAETLTPVVLELGGKSPCIVARDADVEKAARKITWGKFFNAGQTCIAPDYVLAQKSVKQELIEAIEENIREFYGEEPAESLDYSRIINGRHFDRIMDLVETEATVEANRDELYIAPTVVPEPDPEASIMNEEIFGPLLPVVGFGELEAAIGRVRKNTDPLAVYMFSSREENIRQVRESIRSGSLTVNEVLLQAASNYLPFGGVGTSGMGRYRGENSFTAFSTEKAFLERGLFPDWQFRYPPYEEWFDKIIGYLKYFY
ncbi:MAG: aldehyde dehydrogenase family protein [bacterium]